jgi:phosphatidylglycerol:prolipoprotein diacylglycerol transferase
MFVIPYPAIDPVLISIGPLAIRWYALAYIAGLLIGWRYCLAIARRPPQVTTPEQLDDFLLWAMLGVILGGRLGYILFYDSSLYFAHPLQIFYVWRGGMSFHGGALGVTLAILLFCRQRHIVFFSFADIIACAAPIGLFFGRLANFINGELWGRVTTVPWAMKFPTELNFDEQKADAALHAVARVNPRLGSIEDIIAAYRDDARIRSVVDPILSARHPSQLYEAFLEGLVLFCVLFCLQRFTGARQRPGLLTGVFLMGYAAARMTVECVRQPDQQLGFIVFGAVTMGQLLSLPLLLFGLWLVLRAQRAPLMV